MTSTDIAARPLVLHRRHTEPASASPSQPRLQHPSRHPLQTMFPVPVLPSFSDPHSSLDAHAHASTTATTATTTTQTQLRRKRSSTTRTITTVVSNRPNNKASSRILPASRSVDSFPSCLPACGGGDAGRRGPAGGQGFGSAILCSQRQLEAGGIYRGQSLRSCNYNEAVDLWDKNDDGDGDGDRDGDRDDGVAARSDSIYSTETDYSLTSPRLSYQQPPFFYYDDYDYDDDDGDDGDDDDTEDIRNHSTVEDRMFLMRSPTSTSFPSSRHSTTAVPQLQHHTPRRESNNSSYIYRDNTNPDTPATPTTRRESSDDPYITDQTTSPAILMAQLVSKLDQDRDQLVCHDENQAADSKTTKRKSSRIFGTREELGKARARNSNDSNRNSKYDMDNSIQNTVEWPSKRSSRCSFPSSPEDKSNPIVIGNTLKKRPSTASAKAPTDIDSDTSTICSSLDSSGKRLSAPFFGYESNVLDQDIINTPLTQRFPLSVPSSPCSTITPSTILVPLNRHQSPETNPNSKKQKATRKSSSVSFKAKNPHLQNSVTLYSFFGSLFKTMWDITTVTVIWGIMLAIVVGSFSFVMVSSYCLCVFYNILSILGWVNKSVANNNNNNKSRVPSSTTFDRPSRSQRSRSGGGGNGDRRIS